MTSQAMKETTKRKIDKKEFFDKYRSLIALALLVVVVSILSPSFLTTKNIFNVLRHYQQKLTVLPQARFYLISSQI